VFICLFVRMCQRLGLHTLSHSGTHLHYFFGAPLGYTASIVADNNIRTILLPILRQSWEVLERRGLCLVNAVPCFLSAGDFSKGNACARLNYLYKKLSQTLRFIESFGFRALL